MLLPYSGVRISRVWRGGKGAGACCGVGRGLRRGEVYRWGGEAPSGMLAGLQGSRCRRYRHRAVPEQGLGEVGDPGGTAPHPCPSRRCQADPPTVRRR